MADQVSEVLLELTPQHEIDRIVIGQVDGSATEYQFTDRTENVAIPERQFEFSPPPGTEMVEGDLGGG